MMLRGTCLFRKVRGQRSPCVSSGFLLPVVISVTSVVLVVLVMSVALICKKKSADTCELPFTSDVPL